MKLRRLSLAAIVGLASCRDVKLNDNQKEPDTQSYAVPSVQPTGLEENITEGENLCVVDLSNSFIPELFRESRDWRTYFTTDGILADPFQRERFGIFSSFKHHEKNFLHYAEAIERRGDNEQPKINGFIYYTTQRSLRDITTLENLIQTARKDSNDEKSRNKKTQIEQYQKKLDGLKEKVQKVKDIQQILSWEGFYNGKITGVFDQETTGALIRYQKYHLKLNHRFFQKGDYLYVVDGKGRVDKATQRLLNKNFEEHASEGIKRVLEERVFHMGCLFYGSVRRPHVIEQENLDELVDETVRQLNLDNVEGIRNFFDHQPDVGRVLLDIPGRYKKESLKLEIEIEKWSSRKRKHPSLRTKYILYSVENGERVELFRTRAVVGGWNKIRGEKKYFNTPSTKPGEVRYIKSHWIMPYWTPPKWAEEESGDPVTLPGPYNAFGMSAMVLHLTDKVPEHPFSGWYNDDDGIRNHLTPWPSSVEYGGFSHSCIRIHPNMSRVHFFITRYTPHKVVFQKGRDGELYLKFTQLKGSIINYEPGHYPIVRICEETCK